MKKEIIKVKSAGFCFGVKRAIKIALGTAKKYKGEKIFTLGPIIHNNDVVDDLKKKGIFPVENFNLKDSIIILRSHGVEKDVLENLKKNSNILIDATCPYVKKIHDCVKKLDKEGYYVIIIGDRAHPEVKAISSYCSNGNFCVIQNKEELKNLKVKKRKIGVVAQTTQSIENFIEICTQLLNRKAEIRIFNTICNSTSIRQNETINVAKKVDVMIVIGGKHSANTKRLAELSRKYCKNTYHIENVKELNFEWLENKDKIGITAGASTPDYIIDEVIEKIRGLK